MTSLPRGNYSSTVGIVREGQRIPIYRPPASTEIIATLNQSTFSVSYNIGYVDVYQNGSRLSTTQFTASNGSTVVLGTPAQAGDDLRFVSWDVIT